MGVIAFPQFQPQGSEVTEVWRQRTISARFKSTLSGASRTLERPGSEWVCTPRFNNLDGMKRAVWQQFLANCRGFSSRFYMPTFYRNRGSFPAPELLTNNYFASGTTGWEPANPTTISVTAADGLLRVTRLGHNSTTDLVKIAGGSAVSVTQYAPYAARSIDHQGRASTWSSGPQLGSSAGGEEYGRANAVGFGLKTLVTVLPATAAHFGLVDYDTGLNTAGDSIDFSYVSLARCALVDNGPNQFTRSDDQSHADWTAVGLSARTDNFFTAPSGATDGTRLVEDSGTSGHSVFQDKSKSAVAQDWCFAGAFRRGDTGSNLRDRVCLRVTDTSGTDGFQGIFDLTAGTVVSATNIGTGANARGFIQSLGGGWYYCAIVGLTDAETTVRANAMLVSNPTTTNYAGDGASNLGAWRLTLAQSGVPVRLTSTTTAATNGASQTGSALHLKGLPASTNGLLLQGDWVEIITGTTSQAVRARAPLNSDAAGLGYLQFEAPIRISPLDNAAVIVSNPLMRSMLDHRDVEWSEHDDGFSSIELTAVEDLA